nr:uncharacterized protein LOC111509648 [Leptinotarsa decemlineata]
MRLLGVIILAVLGSALAKDCPSRKSNSKLFCYFSKLTEIDGCYCSHVILPANSDVKSVERARQQMKGMKILITVNEFNQGLIDILKTSKIDGLEINLKKLDSKSDISDFISTVRSKLGSNLYLALSVPSRAETLAKYYDFKALSKHADVFILQTAFLGASKNVTFHPSRLSGLWDMQNTDSMVDLVSGLGAPLSKVVITAPVQAFQFTLQNEEFSAPGSPALELRSLTRNELCKEMRSGSNWTMERDQDQAGPYIFSKNKWIAFEDSSSIDIKAKYSRIRGLAGLALKDLSEDGGQNCGATILESAYNGLSRQARAPRGAVLHSLERELVESTSRPLDNVQVSPYRITRIVDVEGHHHIIRQDTRTEFSCSRQGYFVHPRSCNRFYRCVKFDQLSDEYSVFEFDCPAGLAFDERVEVCVWPGSLPLGPLDRDEVICPHLEGYYADPENCRWFFACLDHGKSPLSAYEFRCPFGLMFDSDRLVCEWPWLVPKCGNGNGFGINRASEFYYGGVSTGHQSGVVLKQYDGLGSLGLVKLGGINGKLEQPIIYSNIGSDGFQNGYTGGFRGLGIKATQSLQNAGLLKAGFSGGSNIYGGNVKYNTEAAGYDGLTNNYQTNGNVETGNINLSNGNLGYSQLNTLNVASGHDTLSNNGNIDGSGRYQSSLEHDSSVGRKTSTSDLNQNIHGFGIHQSSSEQKADGQQNQGLNIQYQTISDLNNFGAKSSQDQYYIQTNGNTNTQYSSGETGSYQSTLAQTDSSKNHGIAIDQGLNGVQFQTYIGSNEFGSKSSQNQYQGEEGANVNTQYSLNLNHGSVVYPSSAQIGTLQHVSTDQNLNNVRYESQAASNEFGSESSQSQYSGLEGLNSHNRHSSNLVDTFGQTDNHQNEGSVNNQGLYTVHYQTDTASKTAGNEYAQTGEYVSSQDHSENDERKSSSNDISINIQNQGQSNNGYQYNFGSNFVEDGRAKSTQTFNQFVGQNTQFNTVGLKNINEAGNNVAHQYHGVGDSIDIVGGGYSAVGESKSGVEIYNNGDNNLGNIQSTVAPVTVTTHASIPTVTSVPIPTLKTATGFERYDGGVIANVPQLQFKTFGRTKSSDFVKFISTTPSSLVTGYQYSKPSVNIDSQKGYDGSSHEATSWNYQSHVRENNIAHNDRNVFTVSSTIEPVLNVAQSVERGYEYPKPNIHFEETPIRTVNPAVVTSYDYATPSTAKPIQSVKDSITPLQPVVSVKQPVSYNVHISESRANGYTYEKPAIKFEEVPQPQVVVSSYNEVSTPEPVLLQQPQVYVSSTIAPVVKSQPSSSFSYVRGYDYPKPAIRFQERPVEKKNPVIISKFSIRKPVVQETYVQPTVATYNYQKEVVNDGYHYEKPSIRFEEKPIQPVITSHYISQPVQPEILNYEYSTQKTNIRPVITTYQKPIVSTSYTFKDLVSTYSSTTPKPPIVQQTFKPIVSTYAPVTETPVTYQQAIQYVQPTVVSSYHYQKPSVTRYTFNEVIKKPVNTYLPAIEKTIIQQTPKSISSTYLPVTEKAILPATGNYQKPVATYLPITEKPVFQPDVVSSYNYVPTSTLKPILYTPSTLNSHLEFKRISSTPSPSLVIQTQKNVQFKGYDYPKPSVRFVETYENRQSVEQTSGYNYPRPSVSFVEEPTPFVETYENRQPVEEKLFVKEKAYITGSNPSVPVVVENYHAPELNQNYKAVEAKLFSQSADTSSSYYSNNFQTVSSTAAPIREVYIQTTPEPSYQSTIDSVLSVKTQTPQEPQFYFHDSRLSTSPRPPVEGYSSVIPEVTFHEEPNVSTKYSPVPTREYLPSQSTTTSRPISKFSFSSLDNQYQYVSSPVEGTTSIVRKYLPVKQRVRVTTPSPTYIVPEVTLPPREYLPVRSRVRYTSTSSPTVVTSTPGYTLRKSTTQAPVEVTTLSRNYLPGRSGIRVTTDGSPAEYGELDVTSRRSEIVKLVRPVIKTIIKQNDLHPLLSTKLGAQCTCLSNVLNLKKKQKIIIVEDDDEDDDGYVVENNDQVGTVVENYQYQPQNEVDITPSPQIFIKSIESTTNDLVVPTPSYQIRKRVRVQPVSTTASYDQDKLDLRQYNEGDNTPSDREIAKAVRTGLKLVKQAAKEGAREGAEEVISNYNPRTGNVRDTIECQRAGLFRHPNQCNKFYACRWDCTKNKYTLHTFNCPVHLTFDNSLGACNWPSQGPACAENTLLPSD